MTYKEFDNKYNIRENGVITHTSIIDVDGNIIFKGTLRDVVNYWDNNIVIIFKDNKYNHVEINNKEVVMTNVGNEGTYANYFFSKLNFKVELWR